MRLDCGMPVLVAANKCCHARAMPAGGLDVAAGPPGQIVESNHRQNTDVDGASCATPGVQQQPHTQWLRGHHEIRLSHSRDQERPDTGDTAGICIYMRGSKNDFCSAV